MGHISSVTVSFIYMTLTLASLTAFQSCGSGHYMTTDIRSDLSAERIIYSNADSSWMTGDRKKNPFFFKKGEDWKTGTVTATFDKDFYGETRTMNIYAVRQVNDLDELRLEAEDDEIDGSPLLSPEETIQKRFRWFWTIFEYKAKYRKIEGLPVQVSEYSDSSRQEIFFRRAQTSPDWNGIEMYCALDEINTEFARWYTHSTYEVSYEIIYGLADDDMRAIMKNFHKEELDGMISSSDEDITPSVLCSRLDGFCKDSRFSRLLSGNRDEADSLYNEKEKIIWYFNDCILSEIRLPGKLVSTNASAFNCGNPQWKIDGYRLLYDNLVLEATSRKVNIWAFAVTFVLLSVIGYMIFRGRAGNGRSRDAVKKFYKGERSV